MAPNPYQINLANQSSTAAGQSNPYPATLANQPDSQRKIKSYSINQTSGTPSRLQRRQGSFSLIEILGGAAFTGFEGALLFIALNSVLASSEISMGLWGMILGGLIFAQYRRLIEKIDLVIIAGISLGLVLFVPVLHQSLVAQPMPSIQLAIVLAVLAAAATMAVTAIFRLIHLLLSQLF